MRAVRELDVHDSTLADRLERGEVIYFAQCPFAFLDNDEHEFLLQQRLRSSLHKNISFDPLSERLSGFRPGTAEQEARLAALLARFSEHAERWLAQYLPRYATTAWRDRVSFSPTEEVTRSLRQKARNDLLHIDAFPKRPTRGRRVLRLFVNVNRSDPRIWLTSERFPRLLERYGRQIGLPSDLRPGWWTKLRTRVLGAFEPKRRQTTPYDEFMHRLHNFLKLSDEFQEQSSKRLWSFAPGSAWLAFTDYVSYASLRGRFLLDQLFLVPAESLTLPREAPLAILTEACRRSNSCAGV
jgi:hypothetical protein